MEFIQRDIAKSVTDLASWFPVVSITGPRQSGKSTLSKKLFPRYEYVNLEIPGLREQAKSDPLGFIRSRSFRLIIDEAQYAPELFSAIQVESDLRDEPGQYVVTGSQSFALQRQISQSLAGRVGQVNLLPLSYREVASRELVEFAYKGGYPRLYNVAIPPSTFYTNYVSTYLERDIAGQVNASNITSFRSFVRICAFNAGQLLNVSKIASELGVSVKTVNAWLSLLESSFLVFRLSPWHSNARKRLVKTPKLYFYDTGLLCHLLRIKSARELERSGCFGQVFENLIIAETAKNYFNQGKQPELYFYRDSSSLTEVDLIDATSADAVKAFEIKSSQTYRTTFLKNISKLKTEIDLANLEAGVIMRPDISTTVNGFKILKAEEYLGGSI